MRFYQTLLAGAALFSAAFAVEINKFPSTAEAGKQYEITYSPGGNAATTIILRKGDSNNLANVSTLTTTATGGSYQWTVDRALASGTNYALMIVQGGDANYIGPIAITGGTGASSSASASASASSASSASVSKSASASGSTLSTITAASASASASASGNSTVSLPTLSSGRATATSAKATGGASSTSTGGGAPSNTGAASTLSSSPLALIFGAVAAMAYLN